MRTEEFCLILELFVFVANRLKRRRFVLLVLNFLAGRQSDYIGRKRSICQHLHKFRLCCPERHYCCTRTPFLSYFLQTFHCHAEGKKPLHFISNQDALKASIKHQYIYLYLPIYIYICKVRF